MTAIEKIFDFVNNFQQVLTDKTQSAFIDLYSQFENIQIQSLNNSRQQNQPIEQQNQEKVQLDELQLLDQVELIESRAVENVEQKDKTLQKTNSKQIRVKEIQDQKKKIAQQLRILDQQIQQIKGKNAKQNMYKRYEKIRKDENAQKQAQLLVRQLKNQRKQIQNRKKQEIQKTLLEMQKQEQQRRKIRQQEALRAKQQRRLAIIQRMQQQKKRKQQRRLIEAQSNQLIIKLKKEQQLQKIANIAPSQIFQADQKRKVLQKKNNFNLQEIQQHDRRYRQLKMKNKKEKEQRAQSLKINKQYNSHKYSRNVWIERIQQQEQRKKQQQRLLQEKRRNQLEKRLKYGQLVKNIFLPKRKDKQNESVSAQKQGFRQYQHSRPGENYQKPQTPQQIPTLPKVKIIINQTQNSKMFRQQSMPGIKMTRKDKSQKRQQIKEFDPNQQQRQKLKKIRQQQLRKQTKQRLKKLQSSSVNKVIKYEDKIKYKNYLGQVKIKKDEANEWKKIMNNDKLTEQQKYQEIIKKASDLEAKAKKKQDKGGKNEADQDAVNFYIGSIQAKLALLQKF